MLTYAFPPSRRLRSESEFTYVIKSGKKFKGSMISILYKNNTLNHSRLGISIGRKYGSSVNRNYFKRLVREEFRTIMDKVPSLDLVVIPVIPPEKPTLDICRNDFCAFIELIENAL